MKPPSIYGQLDREAIKWAIGRANRSWAIVQQKRLHRRGSGRTHRSTNEMVLNHLEGAIGEAALSRHLELPLPLLTDHNWRNADVAGWQVRATRWPNGKLWSYESDPPDMRCVLVTIGGAGKWAIRGWRPAEYLQSNGVLRPSRYQGGNPIKVWYLEQKSLLPFPALQASLL